MAMWHISPNCQPNPVLVIILYKFLDICTSVPTIKSANSDSFLASHYIPQPITDLAKAMMKQYG